MIDTSKQYTYDGKPVRIYADGSDTFGGSIHIGVLDADKWYSSSCNESNLVEVWEPKEGELCYFWDNCDSNDISVSKFVSMKDGNYVSLMCMTPFDNCAPFKGELPEAFKGLL